MHTHLKKARLEKGLTQAAVAQVIGRDQATVSKYEAGAIRIDPDVAPSLAQLLGLSILEVLYGPGAGLSADEPVRAVG